MLGLNKTGKTQRLVSNAYQDLLPVFRFRMEPMKFSSEDGYDQNAHNVSFKVACNIQDVQVADRVVFDGKSYVVFGVQNFSDALGKHLELYTRQVASAFHSLVTLRRVAELQPNYDPLFREYTDATKSYDDRQILAMVDPVNREKNSFVKVIDAGKLEEIDWILTMDFPDSIELSDRIIFNGEEYEVKWRIPKPYQILVGLKKSFSNY